jgi:2-polyprenyl-3-methyl-5-hydroxy-6-metoxy-1,4-benzoquinol methylase
MAAFSKSMFESDLAAYYDVMHQYRDYGHECQFAHNLIQKYYPGAEHVLDIGCGTGGHAIEMAQRGYDVTGIDKSQDMINIALEKAEKAGVTIDFRCIDFNDLSVISEFQTAYCLGYTFLYMTTYPEIISFLSAVNEALSSRGVLLVDFINGWSLIEEFHRDKFVYQHEGTTIFQFEQATLKKEERVKHIDFYYLIDHHDGRVKTVFAEEDVRIFFNDEVRMLLSNCGFGNIESFGDYTTDTDADVADIVIIAGRKTEGVSRTKGRD